ncbi:MAG: 3-methyladenine DNA glycosylase AlkD [Mariniblastus sp.]|jgi:3-methyladenine DNA glycosylase AlkD
MSNQLKSPWDNELGAAWLARFAPWQQTLRLIHGTLQLEARKNPQEIRAAASMVIVFCRENLWSGDDDERDRIVELAARQLTNVKQLYETKARDNPKVMTNPNFKNLLKSIDQEVRILEARLADPKPKMPDEPPCTWGDFWV